jgi:hypothetical protein
VGGAARQSAIPTVDRGCVRRSTRQRTLLAVWCLGAPLALARPLASQTPPGCDARDLLGRSDVRQGIGELYAETQIDGSEHVMLVFPDSVDIHPSAIVARRSVRLGVPAETIAIVHTHPAATIEYPSPNDVDALKRLQIGRPGVCSYVAGVTPAGQHPVYEILPDGKTVLVESF